MAEFNHATILQPAQIQSKVEPILSKDKAEIATGYCAKCTKIAEFILGSGTNRGSYHTNYAGVIKARIAGCQICKYVSLLMDLDKPSLQVVEMAGYSSGTITFENHSVQGIKTWFISFRIYAVEEDQTYYWNQELCLQYESADSYPACPPVASSTGSPSSISQVQKWITSCDETHILCHTAKETHVLPTRLIEIHAKHERLVHSKDVRLKERESLQYVTLSHCWGTDKIFTLVLGNISDLTQKIPRDKLTKTFLEAIEVTRSLGYKYLWIDSLCIIQDSSEDWDIESLLMSDIYGGSSLTIAATGAKDGRDGCFFDRETSTISMYQLQMPHGLTTTSFKCYDTNFYERSILKAPLVQRAWAMQERFLTARTIHFTS